MIHKQLDKYLSPPFEIKHAQLGPVKEAGYFRFCQTKWKNCIKGEF